MIKQTVTRNDFVRAFDDYNRSSQFTEQGRIVLYNYLDNLPDDIGEDIELDVIALCCDYSEYKTAYEAMEQYRPEDMPIEGEEGDDLLEIQAKNEAEALRWLQDHTTVIEFDGGVIIQQF